MNTLESIESIGDIQHLVLSGFRDWKRYGHVSIKTQDDLILFNYNTMAMIEAKWNFFERVSRGLIMNVKTGEVVARGFDKFFNWLEGGRKAHGHIVTVMEKLDGSLAILYRAGNGYRLATRGAFDSEQALWATAFMNAHYDLTGLDDNLTLIFEIIYPENRIVVDYEGREDLVLLTARNRHTGDYLPFFPDVYTLGTQHGFALPKVYPFVEISHVLEQTGKLDVSAEGYVVEYSDGSRWKFKGDRYLELQRLLNGLTFRNTLRAMSGGSVQHIFDTVPDEFLTEVREWVSEIETRIAQVKAQVEALYAQAPNESRKDFALWVRANAIDFSPYLFAMADNLPIEPIIYRMVDFGHHDEASGGAE